MPPKRKTPLGESSTNKTTACTSRSAKASNKSAGDSAPKSASKISTKQTFKYSNASTLKKEPKYMNLQWPNFNDFCKDKNQHVPKEGELVDEWCYRVSDIGIPLSEEGGEILERLSDEIGKRSGYWNGWACTEVMENLLKEFNGDIYKKTVSPFKKWAYVEAFATFVKGEYNAVFLWMHNDDGDGLAEVVDMLGVMTVTALDALVEHDLLKEDSAIKNIAIVCLLLLEFMQQWTTDLDLEWACEVVRICDDAGMKLENSCRKQVCATKKDIADLRKRYEKERKNLDLGQAEWKDNEYAAFVRKSANWKGAYKGKFKENHPGGHRYDLTRWSKAEIKKCLI